MKKFSNLEKILYRLILGNENIARASFSIEKSLFYKITNESRNSSHVFVAGLARSGTTILMRSIYNSNEFCSLTYRDMPFILAPNVWEKISSSFANQMTAVERMHKDGILEDYNSPEAFEEVFWRTFAGRNYIFNNGLSLMTARKSVLEDYIIYIDLILKKYSQKRYLSKNNNNIIRLASIRKAFPNSIIIIPFRDPIQHSLSLLKQHEYFCRLHKEDKFSFEYMQWLGHYEFGMNHRPFIHSKIHTIKFKKHTLEYWMTQWINTYNFLLDNYSFDKKVVFLSYEAFCTDTQSVWLSLSKKINIPFSPVPELTLKTHDLTKKIDKLLLNQANRLYDKISSKTGL